MLTLGFGCSSANSNNKGSNYNSQSSTGQNNDNQPASTAPLIFQDSNTAVSFTYPSYLDKADVNSKPGAVSVTLNKRPGESGSLDTVTFSTKTHDAWQAEKPVNASSTAVCDSEDQLGCEKWDADNALYRVALTTNKFDGYYALGASRTTINGVPFVVIVTYNIDTKMYETKYLTYINNTRITFVDPASGALEYGAPFQLNAKNRELVELTAKNLATRLQISDVKNRARSDELYAIVASLQFHK